MYLACYSNSEERKNGSSGGAFFELANKVLEDNGVVYAAIYNSELMVEHVKCTSVEELHKACGSKYVQSNLAGIIKNIKEDLKERKVLFVGTPCQVKGIKNCLKSENLITVDFACHGVPSEKVWKKALEELAEGKEIVNVNMRCKESGWTNYGFSWKIEFNDGTSKLIPQDKVPYMNGFVNDIYLRPSCYSCGFKGLERYSDITLGDFWEIWNVLPKMDDNKGTSILLANTEKGKELFESVKDKFTFKEVDDSNTALMSNAGLMKQAIIDERREKFYKLIDEGKTLEKAVNPLIGYSKKDRIIRKLGKIKNKIVGKDKYVYQDEKLVESVNESKSKCCGCYACYDSCPVDAISMVKDNEGYFYPKIDMGKCINCDKCKRVCPINN